jgi:hypothetical protein
LATLRALDAKAPLPRRFGPDADARWALFKGDLDLGDRLDLLVRDGAATQPTAFAPRVVFALDGLASDEPFGPDWPEPGGELVHSLWSTSHGETTLADLLDDVLRIWGLTPGGRQRLDDIGPADRLVVAGAAAIRDLALTFEGRPDLDLADQLAVVAMHPGERQLFGAAIAWLEPPTPPCLVSPGIDPDAFRAIGPDRLTRALISPDASTEARTSALALGEALIV